MRSAVANHGIKRRLLARSPDVSGGSGSKKPLFLPLRNHSESRQDASGGTFRLVIRKVLVDGRELEISIAPDGTFQAGERSGRFDALEVEPGVWSALVDGKSHTVVVSSDGTLAVDNVPVQVEVIDPRLPRKR